MAQIEARQTKLRQLNQATATLGDLKEEIDDLGEAIEFFRSKLPGEKEIDKVLQEVWRLAEANRLATKSIRTQNPDKAGPALNPYGPYAAQPILIELEGPFKGFYGFLLALEAQPRIIRIHEMALSKPGSVSPMEGHVRATCKVSVFFERGGGS